MKLTTGIVALALTAGTAWAQNPAIIQNTKDALQKAQQQKTAASNAALQGTTPSKPSGAVPAKGPAVAPANAPAVIPAKAAVVPTKAALVPTKAALVPTKAAVVPAKAAVVPAKAAVVPAKAAVVPAKAPVPTAPAKPQVVPAKATTQSQNAPAGKTAAAPAPAKTQAKTPSPMTPKAPSKPVVKVAAKPEVKVAPKATAKPANPTAAKSNAEGSQADAPKAEKSEDKKYSMTGKRDPFLSPVVNRQSGSGCSTGKKCLDIEQVALHGVVKSDNGMIAVVTNSLNKAYFLRENDPVFNGYVVKITVDSIVFKQTLQDRLGKPFTKDVVKRILTPAV